MIWERETSELINPSKLRICAATILPPPAKVADEVTPKPGAIIHRAGKTSPATRANAKEVP